MENTNRKLSIEKDINLSSSNRTINDTDDKSFVSIKNSTLEMSSSMTMDNRILWIKNKVMKFLCLDDSYNQLFDELINVTILLTINDSIL